MATPNKIQLDIKHRPAFALAGLTEENARKASEMMQKNHDEHHIFFNKDGFHVRDHRCS
jgi:UDP-N-acetyl-D-mannosaminuronic acid transferase (WecB/TagA/CpsF family)